MNLLDYLNPLKKWWWLLVVAAVVSGISSAIISFSQPNIYQTRTTLMVGNTMSSPNPSGGEFYLQQQLASIYADMVFREPIRQSVMDALGLTYLPEYFAAAVPNTSLVEIVVNDSAPQRAQVVANELAAQLVKSSPGVGGQDQQTQDFLRQQLSALQIQINDTLAEMQTLQDELAKSNSARRIAELNTQIAELDNRLNTLRSTYGTLLSNTQEGASNTLSVIEPASLPVRPVGPNHMLTIVLSLVVGLALAAVAAYAIEFFDDSVKTAEDVKRILGVQVLSYVGEFPAGKSRWNYIREEPRSPVAHSFRVLRTNLDLLSPEEPIRTVLVTSASTSEGKSTITANLGVVTAQADHNVICVDADFHRPMLHNALEIENPLGFSGVLAGDLPLHDAIIPWKSDRLLVIPAGEAEDNPSELFSSPRLLPALDELKGMADRVIIDGPPFFLSDTSVLCTKVDCVLLVVRPNFTRKEALKAIKEQLDNLHIKRLAVVLNRVARRDSYYSKYYPNEYRSKPEPTES